MTERKEPITCILIDSPIGMLSPPEEIQAWLWELDELEKEVEPSSDAAETIEGEREEVRRIQKFQAWVIASGDSMVYAPARRRPGR